MKEAIDFLIAQDPVFQSIIDAYGVPEIPKRPPGFQTLSLLILEQQVSVDSAKAAFLKLREKVTAFEPEFLVDLSDEEFRACGVSRQKTNYIKGLATAILEKTLDIESLENKSPEIVRDELIKIKGIGNWTIDVYLLFSLNAPDIIPLGDIAVINTIKELFGIHDKSAMELHAVNWSPYRSFATFLLWHHYLNIRNRKITYIY